MTSKQNNNGYTLIEILLMIAFAAMLVSILVVILGSLRLKTSDVQRLRDTRRLSDMTQARTGLELFASEAGGYPDPSFWVTGGTIRCGKSSLVLVPRDPTPSAGTSAGYTYTTDGESNISKTCGNQVWDNYNIEFQTESVASIGAPGSYCLTPTRGIVAGKCVR